MAQPSTSVTSALPKVGIFPTTFPADSPTIRILNMPGNGHVVAYDRDTWTADQIDGLMRLRFGDYELVEAPAEEGAR